MCPVNSSPEPTGQLDRVRASCVSRSRIIARQRSKSAPTRSILLAKIRRGTLYRSAWRHTVSVCGSTPATESSSVTAPSSTRSERSTSTVKSTWPGVSMMLIRYSDAVPVPEAGRRGGRDRDAALLLLLHPVHRGGALVHLTDLVVLAGVVEDALGRRRLPGIDVGHDADVPIAIERGLPGHDVLSCPVCQLSRACEKPTKKRGDRPGEPGGIAPRASGLSAWMRSPAGGVHALSLEDQRWRSEASRGPMSSLARSKSAKPCKSSGLAPGVNTRG